MKRLLLSLVLLMMFSKAHAQAAFSDTSFYNPASGSIIVSGGPRSSVSGVAEVDGSCIIGSSGSWVAGSCSGSGTVYPAAGIANSTGSAWGTSYTTSGTGTVLSLTASPTFTGTVNGTNLTLSGTETLSGISGSTQCLHVSSSGVISGTGSDCGSASGSGTVSSASQYEIGYYASSGTTISGNSGIFTNASNYLGIGTSTIPSALYVSGASVSQPSSLTISTSTYTPTSVASNTFRVVLVHASCPCTIANPSGTAVDGERFLLEVWQSSTGSDTIGTWGTSYDFGTVGAPTLSTGANKGDLLGFTYSAQNSKYNYIGIQQGM